MSRRCIIVDLDRCTGCHACTVACKFENDLGLGNYRCDVIDVVSGVHPNVEMYWLPIMCQQCENAPCVDVCPTGASYRASNGVVTIDESICIGCKSCLTACPYSDPSGQKRPSVRWLRADTNTVTKCTLCNHYTAKSDGVENEDDTFDENHAVPPCVHNCCNGARFFGDLDDPNSGASIAVAEAKAANRGVYQLEKEGAKPTSLYILSDTAEWKGVGDNYVLYAKG